MVFSSLTFLYFFLPIVLALYFAVPKKAKNIILLISGLVFYAWGEPVYIIILIISTLVAYIAGRFMDKFNDREKLRTVFLLISVIINLSLLAVFKYSSFIIMNINALFGTSLTNPKLPLPIGLSFYTFLSMSYTIDLYMRNIKVQKNIINFASYVTLFPLIIAGPIVRYEDVSNEIDNRTITTTKIAEGIGTFIKGLGKKVILANNIGLVWAQVKVMGYDNISVATAWIGILAFTFQIYYDFSGYSDMAIGLGKMLGFNFPQNFNYPYVSKSISEFWRRWNITLSSWFRSYVFIPLGGNKKKLLRTLINLFIVWDITGLWYGARWNFLFWGLYFGILIIIERLGWGKILAKLPAIVSRLYTFILVVIGWVFFGIDGMKPALNYLKAMFGANGVVIDSTAKYLIGTSLLIFVICIIASTEIIKKIYTKLNSLDGNAIQYALPVFQLIIMLISTAFLVNSTYNPFIYF